MSKQVSTKILLRNDSAANWTTNNPTLAKGQIGIQIDTKKFKFGDGTTAWNSLSYGAGADIPLASAQVNGLMSSSDFSKLAGVTAGAQPNVIQVVKKNGTALTITSKAVDIIVPTKTSDLTNDSDFTTTTAVETAINTAISSVFRYKGTKATVNDLPDSGNTTGDVWHVTAGSSEYVWNGSAWQQLGTIIDLSGYLQQVSIAGITLIPSSYTITVAQLQTALGLGAAAYKAVDTSISTSSTSANLPTSQAVATFVAASATKVQASATNGNIKVNDVETTVYTLPSTTLDSSDTLIMDCGSSTTNYT